MQQVCNQELKSLGCERLAKHPAQLWRLIFFARGFQMQAALQCLDLHVHMTAVMCWVWPTTPAKPALLNPLHADSMTVSEHALKAPVSGVAQFGSFSLCQGPLHDECCMNGASGHRTVTGGWCIDNLATPCQEGTLCGRRVWGHYSIHSGPRSWAKRSHFTCLEYQFRPPGWGCTKQYQRSMWSRAAVLSVWTLFFLGCHELPVPLGLLEMIHSY